MIFWLGTDRAHWLRKLAIPMMISRRVLFKRKTFPRARFPWFLDSGAFSELNMYGEWTLSVEDWVKEIRRYRDEIGQMQWVSSQDWMCEPFVLKKTGLSVKKHQELTIANYIKAKELDESLPIIPILQGFTLKEYEDCFNNYYDHGVDLTKEPLVGIGSVCKRERTKEISTLISEISSWGVKLHGFGVKTAGISNLKDVLWSADSMAWCMSAYRKGYMDLPTREHGCSHCIYFALKWRQEIINRLINE